MVTIENAYPWREKRKTKAIGICGHKCCEDMWPFSFYIVDDVNNTDSMDTDLFCFVEQ